MHAPIATLPPELLRQVFLARHRTWIVSEDDSSDLPGLTASHVCSAWRVVALDISELWSLIEIRDFGRHTQQYVAELVRRSGPHLLEVDVSGGDGAEALVRRIGRVLSTAARRIRRFSAEQLPPSLLDALVTETFARGAVAAALEELTLHPSEQDADEGLSEAASAVLSEPGRFPALARLAVAYLPVQVCTSLARDGLTVLSFTHGAFPEATREGLLALLANSPRLEHLAIQRDVALGTLPGEDFQLPSRPATVHLPHLKTLSLAYLSRSCTWLFLQSLVYPEDASVGLLSHLDWPVPHDALSDSFRDTISRVADLSLYIVYREHASCADTFDCTVLLEGLDAARRNVLAAGWKRTLYLPPGEDPPLQAHTADLPPGSLHFAHARSCTVRLRLADGVPPFTREHWADVLGGLPQLRALCATLECAGRYRAWPGAELCYALAAPAGKDADALCPRLERLGLCFGPRSHAESEWAAQAVSRFLGGRGLREVGADPLTRQCLLQYGWGARARVWDDETRFAHPGLE
ncbi:F-box protein [Phanerochaete sordida]|uniref:F-box protein n=1 Tax=Phanerochaete sordida TaxID=48140 RepID=A0A9P3GE43_9APHY|nr:F-box protein [Phanerochaete sordida]